MATEKPKSSFFRRDDDQSMPQNDNREVNQDSKPRSENREEGRGNYNNGGERREWKPRNEGGERKPWAPRSENGGERREWTPREGGERKPWAPRENSGERREWTPREGGERKPWAPRSENGGERREWTPREGGERKPWAPRSENSGERREWKPREGGERKPWAPRSENSGERREWKPRAESGERKPWAPRSENSGERREWTPREGGERKPWAPRSENSGERREWTPRTEGGERKPWAPRSENSGERREWTPREGGERKPWAPRSENGGERREWTPREGGERKPWAPRSENSGERREWKPRAESGERREWTPREGDERKPWAPRENTERKPWAPREENTENDSPRTYLTRERRLKDRAADAPLTHKVEIDPTAPLRLNRYIAMSGVCSRREADLLITEGQVTVNGEIINTLGTKVTREDKICLNGELLKGERKVYIIMNKPKGFVTTTEDPHADRTIIDLLKGEVKERVYPVGRLDKNTTGVLLITNDGELTNELTHPSYEKGKLYHVFLNKPVAAADVVKLTEGFDLEDGFIKADTAEFVEGMLDEIGIEIHSGRNRIVRRMFEHLGYDVVKLDRVYFAGFTKMGLRRGFWRHLTPREVATLKGGSYK